MTTSKENLYLKEMEIQVNELQEEYNLMVQDYNAIIDERVKVRLKNLMDKKLQKYLIMLKEIEEYGNR